MSDKSSKMKLRSELLSILNKYRSIKSPEALEFSLDIKKIAAFQDKEMLAKILFKEIEHAKEEFESICSIFIIEAIDNSTLEKYAINFLQSKEIPDDKKFLILSLMKQKDIPFEYENIEGYMQYSQNNEKNFKDLLDDILIDPEVQIDLLDFYINVDKSDKFSLLENLEEENSSDTIALTFSILSYLDLERDEFKIILDNLLQSNSPYALVGLRHCFKNIKTDFKTMQMIKKSIKRLEDKNPSFCYDDIIKTSKPYDSYMSFVDGNGNFSLGFARKTDKDTLMCFFVVI